MTEPTDTAAIAVALAELRGTMETGFATLNGSLNLLAQRGDQTDQKIDDHEKRLDGLERNRWPLPAVAALSGVGALAVSVWQMTAH